MDYGILSGLYTLFLIFIFIGIFLWAYSKKRTQSFNEAANIIFEDDAKTDAKAKEQAKSEDKDQGANT